MPYNPSVICCSKCDQHKPVSEFYQEHNQCKVCYNAYQLEWRRNRLNEIVERNSQELPASVFKNRLAS